MQKMQEQFSAIAKDGVYAENAGAGFLRYANKIGLKRRSSFFISFASVRVH
jgi:hypothetical protein